MEILRVAVIGSGTMGSGIAMALANAGVPLVLTDASSDALAHGLATIERTYASAVERGRITADERDQRLRRITTVDGDAGVGEVDLVIEAAFEDLAVKQHLFERLAAVTRDECILATNTSTLDIDAIASPTMRPQRVLGMHFFSPAAVMRLVEVVRGARTDPSAVESVVDFARRIGKVPVVVGNCDGFVGNRMLLRYRREAELALERGAAPAQVDAALQRFGFAMGPFAVADVAGIDIGWRAKQERNKRGGLPFRVSDIPDRFVEAGRLGQKSGAGYYRYEGGDRTPHPDPVADEIIATERARLGIVPHSVSDADIVSRCVTALINEGARILEEGIASSASDIDTIWRTGYGFPAERGGPMAYADATGLDHVLDAVRRYAKEDAAFWSAPALLERLVDRGERFEALRKEAPRPC